MKHFLTLILLLVSNTLIAQQYSGNISDFKLGASDVVIFPFGMEYPLKIGNIDKEGNVQLNLNSVDIASIPDDAKSMFLGSATNSFFSGCDDPGILKISDKIKSAKCGTPFIWNNNEQTGALYILSDEKLKPWLDDRYYNEPTKASFFEILYVDQDLTIYKTCVTTYNLESGNVESNNNFKISLKKGFNLIQYKIEDIHKTDPTVTSSIPIKLQITNAKADSEIKWIVQNF